jgi:hypothetical protein
MMEFSRPSALQRAIKDATAERIRLPASAGGI